MRLRRRKEPVLRPEHARLVTEVMTATRGAIRMHEALPAQRDELLAQARRGALACRRFLVLGQRLPGEIDAQPALFPALRALERATCSLVAHAQSPPDPTGALRPGELGTLIGDDLRRWMDRHPQLAGQPG